ncbi:hypothetical protein C8Q75DRAFT_876745 [Abortiporus biennis]|nr:hypothetical protein C8Q75DRAFT_876745 [Abortiporus biennis]
MSRISTCLRLSPSLIDLVLVRTAVVPCRAQLSRQTVRPFGQTAQTNGAAALKIRPQEERVHDDKRNTEAEAYSSEDNSFYSIRPVGTERQAADIRLQEAARRGELSDFDEKVMALKDLAADSSQEQDSEALTYSEDDLLAIYEDLLEIPQSTTSISTQEAKELQLIDEVETDRKLMEGVYQRLLQGHEDTDELFSVLQSDGSSSLSQQLKQRQSSDSFGLDIPRLSPGSDPNIADDTPPYLDVLNRLDLMASKLEEAKTLVSGDHAMVDSQKGQYVRELRKASEDEGTIPSTPHLVRVSVMSGPEWLALTRTCILSGDHGSAEKVIKLMKSFDAPIDEEILNVVLQAYAKDANVQNADRFMTAYLSKSPTTTQRHLHVKAHLLATLPDKPIPEDALSLLHDYEEKGLAPPQKTYAMLMAHLFHTKSSLAHAHAWDMFSHMRYVAHPVPDAMLYTLMIQACAKPSFTQGIEPERALDLFTEMTSEHGIQPTFEAYCAAILACCKSGRKEYINEGFRLAKQMLDSHRDARGRSKWEFEKLDNRFFKSLLEGSKRIGDLARTRWILAEIINLVNNKQEGRSTPSAYPDDSIMGHVFHTYSTYHPPFKRSRTVIRDAPPSMVQGQATDPEASSSSLSLAGDDLNNITFVPPTPESHSSSDASQANSNHLHIEPVDPNSGLLDILPQTSSEVLSEAQLLFDRATYHAHLQSKSDPSYDATTDPFRYVKITPWLIDTYLTVLYSHAPLEESLEVWKNIYETYGVKKTAVSYLKVFDRCSKKAKTERGVGERKLALKFMNEVWPEWEEIELDWKRGIRTLHGLDARVVESINASMIKILALNKQTDRALEILKIFVQKFPPTALRQVSPKLPMRSNRISLLTSSSSRTLLNSPRPLVRMASVTEVPDDTVPPVLTFSDVEILHHKLVASNNTAGIKWLKWMCKSYEGSLKMRRDNAMRVASPKPKMEEDID